MDFGSEYLLPFDCDNVLVLFKWWVLVLRGFLDKDEQRERERGNLLFVRFLQFYDPWENSFSWCDNFHEWVPCSN
jgi:hypothetical protein